MTRLTFLQYFGRVNTTANEMSDLAHPYPPESPFSMNIYHVRCFEREKTILNLMCM